MTRNTGNLDRTFRVIVVLAIGVAFMMGQLSGILAVIPGVVAISFVLTSLVATFPAYVPLGLSTRTKN